MSPDRHRWRRATPQPKDYGTRAEYRWARRNWRRRHGGSLARAMILALLAAALLHAPVVFWVLLGLWAVARLAGRFERVPETDQPIPVAVLRRLLQALEAFVEEAQAAENARPAIRGPGE